MPSLTMRFRGICCHIDPNQGNPFKKRTILPQAVDHTPAHVPYVEFDVDAYDKQGSDASWGDPIAVYVRDGIQVGRFELSSAQNKRGEILAVENVMSTVLQPLLSYEERIPKLLQVETRLTDVDSALRGDASAIDPANVGVVFDMPGGHLIGGMHEPLRTKFLKDPRNPDPNPPPTWPIRRLATFVDLLLEVTGPPVLKFTSLGNNPTSRYLKFYAGTDLITIGNQSQKAIVGVPEPMGVGHFTIYYQLNTIPVQYGAIAEPYSGYVVGCSNSNWP